MEFKYLLSPTRIGELEIKNRMIVPAMGSGFAGADGKVSPQMSAFMEARAKGGFGLIITEYNVVRSDGMMSDLDLKLYLDDNIEPLADMIRKVHENGARIFVQLFHAGREADPSLIGGLPHAPSPIPFPLFDNVALEMTKEDVLDLIEHFADAAERAKKAGADGVEIHACHSSIGEQFMSPYTNKRTDDYGGSIEGRAKFVSDIIRRIKERLGANFPVSVRMNAVEEPEGGLSLTEARVLAQLFEEAGADLLNISHGIYFYYTQVIKPSSYMPAFNFDNVQAIKNCVSIPIAGVGRVNDPYIAEDLIKSSKADLIAFGRESIAEPELPIKIAEKRLDEICPCIGCLQRCIGYGIDEEDTGMSCMINPFAGKETKLVISPAEKKKKICIIGAGPAGLETAWILARRGHEVDLYEKESQPGGQFRLASIPPYKTDIAKAIKYYMHQGLLNGVKYHFSQEVSTDDIISLHPEVVVIATGGKPIIPSIPGIDASNVLLASDVLGGKKIVHGKVSVIGGGLVGQETAEVLAERGCKVTIIEMAEEMAEAPDPYLKERLKEYGVEILTKHQVTAIEGRTVVCGSKDGNVFSAIEGNDHIILALGSKADHSIYEELKKNITDDNSVELYMIGDAKQGRQALEAILEGARLGVSV